MAEILIHKATKDTTATQILAAHGTIADQALADHGTTMDPASADRGIIMDQTLICHGVIMDLVSTRWAMVEAGAGKIIKGDGGIIF